MKRDLRVFITDDSAVMRQELVSIVNKGGIDAKVVGTAPNGVICLKKISLPRYKPDVLLMDIIMPEMDGFETIKHIMDRFPTPVIIVSGLSHKEVQKRIKKKGVSIFESGTVEFVEKPNPAIPNDKERFEGELLRKIVSFSRIGLERAISAFDFKSFLEVDEVEAPPEFIPPSDLVPRFGNKLIIVGASTGGPRAISLLLSKLTDWFSPVIIVQHMPCEMVEIWTLRLQRLYPDLRITLAHDGQYIKPGRIYIAPGGKHCFIDSGKTIRLVFGDKVNFVIPAIDVAFESAARVYKDGLLGVVLTGMGKDGMSGAEKIKTNGGRIIAEHESTCVVPSMPNAVIDNNSADIVVPLHDIPSVLKSEGWI